MKNNNVSFDGKDLTFFVDNVKITNGKFPDSYELAPEYMIDRDSLGKLVAVLTDSHHMTEAHEMKLTDGISKHVTIKGYIYFRESMCAKLINHNKELEDRVERLNKALDGFKRMNDNLSNAIYRHNKLSWFDRMRKIEMHEERFKL